MGKMKQRENPGKSEYPPMSAKLDKIPQSVVLSIIAIFSPRPKISSREKSIMAA